MQEQLGAEEVDDAQLVVDAQAGDVSATVRLLQRHERLLRHVIWKTRGGGHDVDDVLQETAIQIWQHIGTLRDAGSVRAWMARIARNAALKAAKQARMQDELTQEMVLLDGPDVDVERFDLHRDLSVALSALPLLQAQAWRLREVEGLSYRDIGVRLDVSESTVRGSLAAARHRIQETMAKTCPQAQRAALVREASSVASTVLPSSLASP